MCIVSFFSMDLLILLIIKIGDSMFNKHLIINNNGEIHLYLYIDFNYEFGKDLRTNDKESKTQTLREKIIEYIREKHINVEPVKVFLVVGGLVIGSIFVQNYKYNDVKNSLEPNYQYVEEVDVFNNKNIINTPSVKTDDEKSLTNEDAIAATTNTTLGEAKVINQQQPKQTTIINESTNTTSSIVSQHKTQSSLPVVEELPPPPPPTPSEPMVTLYRSIGTIETMSLEDYVVGVVSGEMPASFATEALKAQSVIARTYALKRIEQNQILKDDVSNQVYKDNSQLKALWGTSFDTYYNKIKKAVEATKGQTLTYGGKYIEAVYHSTSNGITEDAMAVWGNNFPYLKPVDSHWDLDASSYLKETEKEFHVLSSIIGLDFTTDTNIEVLSRTAGNRIDKIKIDDKIFSGVELRNLLGLRSADFDIRIEDGKTIITTRGYGHGVGMSQYGANGMAKEGYNYKQILEHYYPNTNIKS